MNKNDKNRLVQYILKNSNKNEENLKYDFMPSLLEIIEKPANIASKVITKSIIALVVIAIIWSSLAKIDIVVVGNGSIIPRDNIKIMKSMVNSTVNNINVEKGDYVNEGDLLIELDSTTIEAEMKQLQNTMEKSIIEKEILEKYKEDIYTEIIIEDYDEKHSEFVKTFIIDNKIKRVQLEKRIKEIEEMEKDLEETKAKGVKRDIDYQTERLEDLKENFETSKLQDEISATRSIINFNETIIRYENEMESYHINMEQLKVKAPTEGYIGSLGVNYVGQTIIASDTLATIVPSNEPLEFECYIKDKDIAEISVGDEAEIKIQAISYAEYGAIKGVVVYVSPTAFQSEKEGNVYNVRIEIASEEARNNIELISGMSGSADIKVGKRSILQYFLEPIQKGFSNSLKEK